MPTSEQAAVTGLDTSIVLRLLVGEPAGQAEVALKSLRDLFAEGRRVIVSDLVVAESYFALHAHYGVPKRQAIRTLLQFLHSDLVSLEAGGSAVESLEAMVESSQKPGFVDRLIHAQYQKQAGTMLTFEKASGKLEKVEVLKG